MTETKGAPDPIGVADRPDAALVAALLAGDEASFARLVDRWQGSMLRVARAYTPSLAVAEEAVQETWLAVFEGLERFEGRSSLRTWVFRILVKQAIKRGTRERRSAPFSALAQAEVDEVEVSVDPDRFLPDGHALPGHWASPPRDWGGVPDDELLRGEVRAHLEDAISNLPPAQRTVLTLRDVDGWSSDEVGDMLAITLGNQRVLLHRARTKVRRALASYLADD